MRIRSGLLAMLLAAAAIATPLTSAAGVDIHIGFRAPPARYEVVPAPRHGYAWTPGYWEWRGRHYVWVGGHWVRAHPGFAYHQPNPWVERSHWHPPRGRDLDRDGIPNRFDRDRDGDGVPNRFDRQPDNPRRR